MTKLENTAVSKRYINKDLVNELIKFITLNPRTSYEYDRTQGIIPTFVTGKTLEEENIPNFPIPVKLELNNKTYLVTDVRMLVGKGIEDKLEEKIKDKVGFSTYEAIIALTIDEMQDSNISGRVRNYVVELGAIWFTNSIANTLHLDAGERTVANIVIAHYLLSGYGIESDAIYKTLLTKLVSFADKDMVEETFENLRFKKPVTIEDLSTNIKEVLRSRKVEHLNAAVIISSLRNSFFGVNSEVLTNLALEDINTLTAIIYIAATDRSFRRSKVGSIVLDNHKRLDLDNFINIIKRLINFIKI